MFVGLPEFTRKLKKYAPVVYKQFNVKAREVSRAIAAEAQGLASWSSRIPAAIGATTTAKGPGVKVARARAPHGPLYERGAAGRRSSQFRHPLFGNKKFWFTQQVRPFLQPAVETHRKDGVAAMLLAVEEAKREVGLE